MKTDLETIVNTNNSQKNQAVLGHSANKSVAVAPPPHRKFNF